MGNFAHAVFMVFIGRWFFDGHSAQWLAVVLQVMMQYFHSK